jgi:hypothetical protein
VSLRGGNQIRFVAALAAALATMAGAAAAAAAEPVSTGLEGYWEGTLGGKPVVACFQSTDRGSYAYRAHGDGITLRAAVDGTWLEEGFHSRPPTGVWFDVAREGDAISGSWKPFGGGTSLPIRLARLAPLGVDKCEASPLVDADDLRGVWIGTVAAQPVVACFSNAGWGQYYYTSSGRSISLQASMTGDWIEGSRFAPNGRWSALRVAGGRIQAEWVSPKDDRRAPIRLTRNATLADDGKCGESAAYDSPRHASTKIVEGPGTLDLGLKVRKLTVFADELSVLQLVDTDAAGERINAALRTELETAIRDRQECNADSGGAEFAWSMDTLALADAHWLVVRTWAGWYCGGPHPDSTSSAVTFDRRSGNRVDTSGWFGADGQVPDALAALVSHRALVARGEEDADPEDSCRGAWEEQRGFEVWPSRGGLTFAAQFSHAMQACSDEVELPMDEVRSFLSPAGLAALLRADAR